MLRPRQTESSAVSAVAAPISDRRARRAAWQALNNRKGAVIVLAAVLMIAMMAMLAFAVDVGYILKVDTDLDRSVDAAALAGAGRLIDGETAAREAAVEFLVRNPAGKPIVVDENNLQQRISEYLAKHGEKVELEVGAWDRTANNGAGAMVLGVERPSAIKVSVVENEHPLFFGRVLGRDFFTARSEAVGGYQPRDIVLVLDLSGSMSDDSRFNAYSRLGKAAVDQNLQQMRVDMGWPQFGTLPFEPAFARCKGTGNGNNATPTNYVTYRNNQVRVESNRALKSVQLKFNNGQTQTFNNLSGTDRTFQGSGANASRTIYEVRVQAGTASSGEYFNFNPNNLVSMLRGAFGLTNNNYPYSGNWDPYINWAIGTGQNANAGHRYQLGYKSFLVYLMEQRYLNSQTPDFWKASAQPITAVKNAVDLFIDYIEEVDTDDRMGLAVYNAPNGNGHLETPMVRDLNLVKTLSRQKQAGHYHNYTNIGGGMATARQELVSNSRPGAYRLMVLMTDGNANWVNGTTNTNAARNYVIQEANAAKAARIPIMTISLGAGADTSLMQQVADITGAAHFVVPGGTSIEEMQHDLRDVFKKIADDRPLQLIK